MHKARAHRRCEEYFAFVQLHAGHEQRHYTVDTVLDPLPYHVKQLVEDHLHSLDWDTCSVQNGTISAQSSANSRLILCILCGGRTGIRTKQSNESKVMPARDIWDRIAEALLERNVKVDSSANTSWKLIMDIALKRLLHRLRRRPSSALQQTIRGKPNKIYSATIMHTSFWL